MALTYCDVAPGHEWHGPYHEQEYGFPLSDDAALFGRLVLEINQAGLSWLTILKKRDAFRRAYGGFDPEVVAAYRARDRRSPGGSMPTTRGPRPSGSSCSSGPSGSRAGRSWGEFLMSTGYLPGAHAESCPAYARVAARRPAWMRGDGRLAPRPVDPSHGRP
jgi:DNA-3-methyladenine glycosylase I